MAQHCQKYALDQKSFKWKLFRIEFCTKKSAKAYIYLPQEWSYIEPQRESNFPFLYIIRFQTYWSLEFPYSIPGGDKHMCSWTFLYEIQS